MERSADWFDQAKSDLAAAESLLKSKNYAQSCFYCHQVAEKALKALLEHIEEPTWGHDLIELYQTITQVKNKYKDENIKSGLSELNLFYIATRYPDAFTSGHPSEKFSKKQADDALDNAKEVLHFVNPKLTEK